MKSWCIKDREISEGIFNLTVLASSSKKPNQITNHEGSLKLKRLVRVGALVRFFEEGAKLKTPSAIFPSLHG